MIRKSLLIMFFILLLLPIYWMFIGSFQDTGGLMSTPPKMIPNHVIILNYVFFFDNWPVVKWLYNTIFVTIFTVIISTIVSLMTAYVFAFYKFAINNILWHIFLIGIMLPRISLLIPTYIIIKNIGLSGQLWAVILPLCFSPIGIYLARNYFESIPISLLESARLDGANELQVLYKIVAPLSKPIVTALALFSSIGVLQDYIWQMLVLQNESNQTLIVGLIKAAMMRGGGDLNINPIGRQMAVGIILLFPLLLIFLIANKYFTKDMLSGAVKE